METDSKLILSQDDYLKLSSLLSLADSNIAELLEDELSRAMVVSTEQLPDDVVSMKSMVRFIDLETAKESVVTLVYPHEAKIEDNKISILTPIGSALIGLRVGQSIQWPMPNGKEKKLKVVSVTNDLESAPA